MTHDHVTTTSIRELTQWQTLRSMAQIVEPGYGSALSRASHAAAFAAGVLVAAGIAAHAVPKETARFQALNGLAQALTTVQQSYVDPIDEVTLIQNATRGMLHSLDVYSTFLPASRYQNLRQDTEGEFGSIGITLSPGTIDDARPEMPPYPSIESVVARSPADMAGLQLDDRVVAVDGAPTAEASKELANATAWEDRLRGASGTRVTVSVLRVGWKSPRTFTLVRAQIKLPSVASRVQEARIGYLAIHRFAEATSADVGAGLAKLRQHQALGVLILDLRGNPGGLVDQAIAVADHFLDHGTIVTIRGRQGSVETQAAHKGGPATAVPIIILVDHGTASASEILAAALRDHGRARLVGTPTYGKGTVQTFFDLEGGAGLKLTTARYYTPNGKSLESKGLIPDERVEDFAGEEIVVGPAGRAGAQPRSGAKMPGAGQDEEDPQLVAAVKLARQALRPGHK